MQHRKIGDCITEILYSNSGKWGIFRILLVGFYINTHYKAILSNYNRTKFYIRQQKETLIFIYLSILSHFSLNILFNVTLIRIVIIRWDDLSLRFNILCKNWERLIIPPLIICTFKTHNYNYFKTFILRICGVTYMNSNNQYFSRLTKQNLVSYNSYPPRRHPHWYNRGTDAAGITFTKLNLRPSPWDGAQSWYC